MRDLVPLFVSLVLGVLLPSWIIRYDERSLTREQQERAFLNSTFWVAVVVFGPLCLPIHFLRTRSTWVGLGLGLVALAGTLAAIAGVSTVFWVLAE